MHRLKTIRDVAEYQLCSGCGACAFMDAERIRMVDDFRHGRRPVVRDGSGDEAHDPLALKVCPGIDLEHTFERDDPRLIRELTEAWGPVQGVYEGHAVDDEVRFAGSSGGAATALALHGIENEGCHGVLHVAGRSDVPYLNETVMSTTRGELLARTGSRYAPASPCDGLDLILKAPGPCIFIGKPCDVAAVNRARRLRPDLDAKIALTIAFFCAGVPTTAGTLALLRSAGVEDPDRLISLRYRGNGWPGHWTARFTGDDGVEDERSLTYEKSWRFLSRYKQWRCKICPDHTGEFADIAVGDPWYRTPQEGEPGTSLLLVRTPRGQAFLDGALRSQVVAAQPSSPDHVVRSQPSRLQSRGLLWGHMIGLRLTATPRPRYQGFETRKYWLNSLSLRQKVSSVYGTVVRVLRHHLRRRQPVSDDGLKHRAGSAGEKRG